MATEERKAEELVELLESRRLEAEREEEALRLHHRQEVQELQEQAARLKSESEMQGEPVAAGMKRLFPATSSSTHIQQTESVRFEFAAIALWKWETTRTEADYD